MHPGAQPGPGLLAGGAASYPDMTYEVGGTYGSGTNLSSYSSSVSIGSAPASGYKRAVLVFAGSRDNATRSLNSVTIGGISATQVVKGEYSQSGAYGGGGLFWRDDVSSGTTATVQCNWSGEMAAGGFCVVSIYYEDTYTIEVKDTFSNETGDGVDGTYTNGLDGEVDGTQGGLNFAAIGGNFDGQTGVAGTDFSDLTSQTTDSEMWVAIDDSHTAGTKVCTWSGVTPSQDGGWLAAFGYAA